MRDNLLVSQGHAGQVQPFAGGFFID